MSILYAVLSAVCVLFLIAGTFAHPKTITLDRLLPLFIVTMFLLALTAGFPWYR